MKIELTREELACIYGTLILRIDQIKQHGVLLKCNPKVRMEGTLIAKVAQKLLKELEQSK